MTLDHYAAARARISAEMIEMIADGNDPPQVFDAGDLDADGHYNAGRMAGLRFAAAALTDAYLAAKAAR